VCGYKKPQALLYECGAMLAQGAKCSIGDHLHPTGRVDQTTYKTIAPAYAHVKALEPWAEGSVNVAEIGVLSAEAASKPRLAGIPGHHVDADEGAVRLLLEGKFTFDLLDLESDFAKYRLLILPDVIQVSPKLKSKVAAFAKAGGRVLLTGTSGVDPAKGFVFDVGAKWMGHSPYHEGDFLLPVEKLRASFVDDPLFMYLVAERIKAGKGKSVGDIYDPYFDRAAKHFSGHVNTPSQPDPSGFDAGSENGAFVYFAHPLFTAYKQIGAVAMLEICEKVVLHALGRRRIVETSLPRAGRATLRRQAKEKRDVLHLLYANPALRGSIRGDNVQPIQDVVTLRDIEVSIEAKGKVRSVKLAPEGKALNFRQKDGRVSFTVPALTGHQAVEIGF